MALMSKEMDERFKALEAAVEELREKLDAERAEVDGEGREDSTSAEDMREV